MMQIWENGGKPNLISGPKIFFVSFTSTTSQKLLQAIILCNLKENHRTKLKKMSKKLISGMILAYLAQIYLPPPSKKKNKQTKIVGSTSTRCQKLSQAITLCNFKENF